LRLQYTGLLHARGKDFFLCWLVIASPLVAPPPPCIAFRRTAASRVHPRPPLFVSASWLLRRILWHRLRLSTRRRLACCLLRHLRLTSASSPSLAPKFSSPPLSAPRPSPASSNARRTLPAAALPTATVPFCTAFVLQHVRLRAGSRVASCGTFALNLPARPLSHRHCRRPLSRRRGHRQRPQMHGALSRRRHRQRPLFPLDVHLRRRIVIFTAQPSTILAQLSSYLGGR
jgi:hypothetical protein